MFFKKHFEFHFFCKFRLSLLVYYITPINKKLEKKNRKVDLNFFCLEVINISFVIDHGSVFVLTLFFGKGTWWKGNDIVEFCLFQGYKLVQEDTVLSRIIAIVIVYRNHSLNIFYIWNNYYCILPSLEYRSYCWMQCHRLRYM